MKAWREPKADYTWKYTNVRDIHITDLNLGNMSVTNDVENILGKIHQEIDLRGRLVTYTDSEGQIDKLIIDANGEFVTFAPGDR